MSYLYLPLNALQEQPKICLMLLGDGGFGIIFVIFLITGMTLTNFGSINLPSKYEKQQTINNNYTLILSTTMFMINVKYKNTFIIIYQVSL